MRNILYLLLCICCNIKAQTNDTTLLHIDIKEAKHSHSCKYTIVNRSTEDYLTWVAAYPVSKFSNERKIRYYFYFAQQYWDFNLFLLICEEQLKKNDLKYIGKNFIKRISPGKSFTYRIKDFNVFKEQWIDRLVILKRKEVEESLRIKLLDDWFYKGKKIDVYPQKIFFERDKQ